MKTKDSNGGGSATPFKSSYGTPFTVTISKNTPEDRWYGPMIGRPFVVVRYDSEHFMVAADEPFIGQKGLIRFISSDHCVVNREVSVDG